MRRSVSWFTSVLVISCVFVGVCAIGREAQAQAPPAAPVASQPTPVEPLRMRIEQLQEMKPPMLRGVRLLQRDATARFFQARSFTSAWSKAAADQVLQAIREIEKDGLTPADYHLAAIEALRAAQVPVATNGAAGGAPPSGGTAGSKAGATAGAAAAGAAALVDTPAARDVDLQILLTDAVGGMIDQVRYGKVRPVSLDRRWNVDPREGAPPLESLIAGVVAAPAAAAAIESLKPAHFIYRGLKQALASQRALAAGTGWTPIAAGTTLKPGASDPRVVLVRKRLAATGELPAASATENPQYDEDLAAAVKTFQGHHRLTADGAIGRATVDAMNVVANTRVGQIRVNLERARWVLSGLSDTFILVNLPAFKAYLIRDKKNVWETLVQVGKAGRQTPAFRADMRYLVLNPDWTVPPTILAKDVLAAMRKGQNAIEKKKLTIFDRQGKAVAADSIDWTTATTGNFPYTLRQPPGPDNALGQVKFIFPNEHSIFLHDTPSRQLFRTDERTFSSGCIRVQNPLDLAAVLLDDQPDWTRPRIQEVADSGKTETVFLKQPLPVLIVYWTVSVGASGELRYARDVYNLDPAVLKGLNSGPR